MNRLHAGGWNILVEAGEPSGTLKQAKAALKQGCKVFILNNNFVNPHLTWPQKLEEAGAIRVHDVHDILQGLTSGPDKITEDNQSPMKMQNYVH